MTVALGGFAALLIGAVGLAFVRGPARRSGPMAQRRYLVSVGVVALWSEVAILAATTWFLLEWPREPWALVAAAVGLSAVAVCAVRPARRPTSQLDRIVASLVLLLVTTAAVCAVLVLLVLLLLGRPSDAEQPVVVATLVTVVCAALLGPACWRVADRVSGGLLLGTSPRTKAALRSFPDRMSRRVPMEELLQQLVELLRGGLDLDGAEVWRREGDHLRVVAMVPHRARDEVEVDLAAMPALTRSGMGGTTWVELWLPGVAQGRDLRLLRAAPVLHAGVLLGVIVLQQHPEAAALAGADEELVVELARQVGLALHNSDLDSALRQTLAELQESNEELQRSRARVVSAADAERRRIERNLHDGAQQQLVALAVNLRLARDVVAEDPEDGVELLGQLADSVKDTIAELRALAHGIYPPLLVDAGLGEALRAAAGRSPSAVTVEGEVGRYRAEVEAAVYFCCLEALQNSAKHAPAATVEVRLVDEGDRLRFTIVDDGPGFDAATATKGHGFVNMSDRLGAFGGKVRWESAPGHGSKVSGWVPVGGDRRDQPSG